MPTPLNPPAVNPARHAARTLLNAVAAAAVRAPVAPPHRWPRPRRRGLRWLVIGIWTVLAFGWAAGAVAELLEARGLPPDLATPIGLLQAAPLALAMRWPLVAWRIMASGMLAGTLALAGSGHLWPWPVTASLALGLVLFQVAASYDRQVVAGAGVLTALGVLLPGRLSGTPLWLVAIIWGVMAAILAFGDALGGRRAAEERLAEQTALRRADLARQAVLEERGRIARELHDVVAHHMSMIAIQAEAAPHKIPDLPPEAAGTLAVISRAAREALGETRRVVGLLRDNGEAPERDPQPGLAQVDDLVQRARQAGLTVEPVVVGVPRPLAAGVDLSAYRIVQEALSNAVRYAPGARVVVEIGYGTGRLRVAVTDDGPATGPPAEPGGGHGLVGMRERVTMLGGTLTAEPRAGSGFTVVAELPHGGPDGSGGGAA